MADIFVRYLLGTEENKDLLINFINAVFSEKGYPLVVSLDVINPFNIKERVIGKETILDIKAKDSRGRIINIEVQISDERSFANRSLYYWAQNYQRQLTVTNPYTILSPVVCINLINFTIFPGLNSFHNCFQITEKDNPGYILTEHLQIHFIELKKLQFEAEKKIHFKDELEQWCYYFRNEGYLKEETMPVLLKENKVIQKAHQVYEKFVADPQKMAMIEAREKWERDNLSRMEASWIRGHEEGIEQGIEQGIKNKSLEVTKKMLEEGAQIEMIERVTGLSRDVILKFQEEQKEGNG